MSREHRVVEGGRKRVVDRVAHNSVYFPTGSDFMQPKQVNRLVDPELAFSSWGSTLCGAVGD